MADDQNGIGIDVTRIGVSPAVFEVFYRQHVDAVQNFLARRVGDPYLVADLTAEVFLAAIDSASSYSAARGAPAAWLYGIARHVAAAEFRRAEREGRAAGRFAGRRFVDSDDYVRLEQRIDAERQARALYRALGRLSDGERAVLELVALDDLTVAQAAQALGISGVSARVRLYRARRLLRHLLVESEEQARQLTVVLEVES